MAGSYWQAIWLIAGTHAVATGQAPPRRVIRALLAAAFVLAVSATLLTGSWPTPARFAVRTVLSYAVVLVAFVFAGASVLRGGVMRRELGRSMVGTGFLLYGVQRGVGIAAVAAAWGRPPSGDALQPFVLMALADFMVFAFIALGMVVWLLEEQREAARSAGALAALGTLVAGVAHEARNPLFGLTATLDAFEAGRGRAPELQPFLAGMRASLQRLQHLMEQLLELGRPIGASRERVDVGRLLGEEVAAAEPLARGAGVRVALELDGSVPALELDRARMAQVFRNLIENAVQHSPAGASVRLRLMRADGASVLVQVEDEGEGFAPEDLAHVFDPFYSRRRGGTGLGLAIVRRIVEQHGGRVSAANRSPRGARVLVELRAGG
jgi:signal transduction histidine kinase